jgi:GNAT superfamily N-acetyltransferase
MVTDLSALTILPVTIAEWPDMQRLFSEPGDQNGCWCMYWRIKHADFHSRYGDPLRRAMERIIQDGHVPGLLAYMDDQPIGWVSVAPREDFPVLNRSRTLKPIDNQPVWSITCFFVAAGHRRQGVSSALIEAAVSYARKQGARIVEAYPTVPESTLEPHHQSYMGQLSTFEKAGFREVARRSSRRAIVRIALARPS